MQKNDLKEVDFKALTACGECCAECRKKLSGICKGCIESDGYVPEWEQSGRCKAHACTREHNVTFCGICSEFPCENIGSIIHWKENVIEQMKELADKYMEIKSEE